MSISYLILPVVSHSSRVYRARMSPAHPSSLLRKTKDLISTKMLHITLTRENGQGRPTYPRERLMKLLQLREFQTVFAAED